MLVPACASNRIRPFWKLICYNLQKRNIYDLFFSSNFTNEPCSNIDCYKLYKKSISGSERSNQVRLKFIESALFRPMIFYYIDITLEVKYNFTLQSIMEKLVQMEIV